MVVKKLKILCTVLLSGFLGFLAWLPSCAYADIAKGISMNKINVNVTSALHNVSEVVQAVAILAGIVFFVAFCFKLKQHKDNPTQVTIGQPLIYLFLAISLSMLPMMITTSKRVIFGPSATNSKWDHRHMNQIFGPVDLSGSQDG